VKDKLLEDLARSTHALPLPYTRALKALGSSGHNALETWYFIAEQTAPAPHLAHPEGYAALHIVLVTVPRVSRAALASIFRMDSISTSYVLAGEGDGALVVVEALEAHASGARSLDDARRYAVTPSRG